MKFKFYRYFINPSQQTVLFSNQRTKEDLFIEAIQDKRLNSFKGKKSELGFVTELIADKIIYCKFGKRSYLKRTLPPKDNFKEEKTENWPICHVFINTSNDPEKGQQIAIQQNSSIFYDTLYPLRILSDKINEINFFGNGYTLSINPISEKDKFWEIISRFEGQLEELKFIYNTPNLFNLENSLNTDLRKLRDDNNATEATVIFKNKTGKLKIKKQDPLIEQSIDYIDKGGGEYILKAKKKIIKSNDSIKTKMIDSNLELRTSDQNIVLAIARELFQ